MTQPGDISGVALASLSTRIGKVFPAQIRSCIEQLTDEQLWWRPNKESNSVGNLVLHVRGAVLHYLYHRIGGGEYQRDRPAEFAAQGPIPRQQLLAMFDEMVEKAGQTFAALDTSRLSEPSTEPAYYSTVLEDLLGIAVHLATHTGQIIYVTKMLEAGSVDDLWSQTHRGLGAWKKL
jgi:hypothetical protein